MAYQIGDRVRLIAIQEAEKFGDMDVEPIPLKVGDVGVIVHIFKEDNWDDLLDIDWDSEDACINYEVYAWEVERI